MRFIAAAVVVVSVVAGVARPARAQDVSPPARVLDLTFEPDGNVSLSAKNVTIREILAEWARQCGCYVVNAEKLPGGTLQVPLLYPHEPQGKVLDSLLRSAAGYVLTPQREGSTSRSSFETIYILPTSNPVASAYTPPATAPAFQMPTTGSPEDEIPPVVPGGAAGPPRPEGPFGPGPVPLSGPANTPATSAPRLPGVPSSFVPIVAVGSSQTTTQAPGTPTPAPAPGTVTPVPGRTVPPPAQLPPSR